MAGLIEKIYVKTNDDGSNPLEMYFKVNGDYVIAKDVGGKNQTLNSLLEGLIYPSIVNCQSDIGTLAGSVTALDNKMLSMEKTIKDLKDNDFINSIKPAKIIYDSSIEALKISFQD